MSWGDTQGSNTASSVNQQYNPITNLWSTKVSLSPGKMRMTTSAVGDKIYLIGGSTTNSMSNADAENRVYNTVTNFWSSDTPMTIKRQHLSSSVVDGKIYVIGGITFNMSGDDIERSANEEFTPTSYIKGQKALLSWLSSN